MRRTTLLQTVFSAIFIIQISVTFGQGDSCEECINIENTPGIENDPELIGSYKLRVNHEDYDCPKGCAYEKENDDSVWCFKPGSYKYTDKCFPSTSGETPIPMTTDSTGETPITMTIDSSSASASSSTSELSTPTAPSSQTLASSSTPSTPASSPNPTTTASTPTNGDQVTKKTIFIEGDTVVEQEDAFDPSTGDVQVKVPAHGNNVAVTVLIGGQSNSRSNAFGMVTSFDDYCLVGPAPAISTSAYSNPEESDEFTNSTIKSHYLNVIEADLTEEERDTLPESFRVACRDKPIKKGRQVLVTEDSFDEETFDNVDGKSRSLLRLRDRDGSCGNQTTSCSKFDRGCYFYWSNPSGGSDVRVHSISYTLQCLSCCVGEGTDKLCQCSDINNGRKWKECYKKTNGACDFKGWKCDSTNKCLKYSEQCDNECYGSLDKCGDSCVVPKTETASSFQYSCQDKCVNSSVICDGKCPEGTSLCGYSCVPDRQKQSYSVCDGSCQPRYKRCNGNLECPEGTFECDGTCRKDSRYSAFTLCDGKCQRKTKPCNGKCPENYLDCDGKCRDERWWKLCDGKCQRNDDACNGECPEGFINCNGKCRNERHYRICNGKCLYNYYACDGKCREGYIACNGYCWKEKQWKYCNGKCIWKNKSCPSPGLVTTRSTSFNGNAAVALPIEKEPPLSRNMIARKRMSLKSRQFI